MPITVIFTRNSQRVAAGAQTAEPLQVAVAAPHKRQLTDAASLYIKIKRYFRGAIAGGSNNMAHPVIC